MPKSSVRPIRLAVAAACFSLSCGFLDQILPQGDTAADPLVSGGADSGEMEELTDPRIEAALSLRSVRMVLRTVFPGSEAEVTEILVDANGNQRISLSTPVPEEMTGTPESEEWNLCEIFVVGGSAYTRMGKTGSAFSTPEEKNALAEILYNPTGPGMWLILLPEEDFNSAGEGPKGGFDAEKYTVNGAVDAGAIQGEFWVDGGTGALVGAEFHLDEAILRPVESGVGGTVTITFTVEKALVPAISIP